MYIVLGYLCLALAVLSPIFDAKDLYAVLGLKRTASQKDIRSAYRNKARETHPDKHISEQDKIEATIKFREVVEAYEVLSDESSRSEYDRNGQTASGNNQRAESRNSKRKQDSWSWQWDFNSFFNKNRNSHQNFNQQQQQQQPRKHRYFFDPYIRPQILDAQSRVITIRSKRHLKSIVYSDADDPITNPNSKEPNSEVLDRYMLIAFYNSSVRGCRDFLFDQLLYPWPYAGYSGLMRDKSDGIWWEEIMIVSLVDVQASASSRELGKFFGISEMSRLDNCPSIGFIPRGGKVEDRLEAQYFASHDKYAQFVWSKLKMNIYFKNNTPWPLTQYWLDGMRGNKLGDILPGETYTHNTYISHTFFARADFVTGYTLTNESALLWYVSKIQDDGKTIEINERCFDRSGECARWKQEGFCSRTIQTFYTMQNPGFIDWVINNCFVSCRTGCGDRTIKSEL